MPELTGGRLGLDEIRGMADQGQAMPAITHTRRNGDQHRYNVTNREAYAGVKAYWNDTSGAERKIVLTGSGDNAKTHLRQRG